MPLDSFQREVLERFFRHESHFFLTGGAALAEFHLRHRDTKDLDLFTTGNMMEEGVAALHAVAEETGASLEPLRTAATFRRFLLRRGVDSVIVDLVRDLAPQIYTEKLVIGKIRVDPPQEILVNKLCTLLARAELRDLVDVQALARCGYSIEEAVAQAARKDGGMSPGQLAWVVSEITIGDDATPPGGVSVTELRTFLSELQTRLTAMAFPK